MTQYYVATELADRFSPNDLFNQVDHLTGEIYREVANRRTIKVRIGDRNYFAKIHHGVGWKEIFKNLVQGRLPVLGARNEWLAISHLERAGVPTMTAALFCEEGMDPSKRRSAILTCSLENKISLEDFETEDLVLKRRLIQKIAQMASGMHGAGINHRDYYLCHFLMDYPVRGEPGLHLIDLHRAQLRKAVPARWLEKDLGGLLFSALEKNLTRRDLLRFVRTYSDGDLRSALRGREGLWKRVLKRAEKLYLQDHDQLSSNAARLLEQP
ncbi:MAG: lipopolysaccharide core heptose(I) kinase RfaP [Gammaproteobacteria bacterium]|nr:lipopolysaccharide core heptose(I) kinase RfaP [Gammaproteobacteria bacterium]MBT4494044.1 lipopolysaccharide core heptose(I) kinase RfaP [Gammaproteobacteria bacterium]MBT7369670.1 lipopolysaccharide core heptose(I) kinase RfaP [Gammaproteobacteria bacterium]